MFRTHIPYFQYMFPWKKKLEPITQPNWFLPPQMFHIVLQMTCKSTSSVCHRLSLIPLNMPTCRSAKSSL